jgi:hypothetical protein
MEDGTLNVDQNKARAWSKSIFDGDLSAMACPLASFAAWKSSGSDATSVAAT